VSKDEENVDQFVITEETAYETGISYRSVQSIMKEDLSMWHACKPCAMNFDRALTGVQECDCCWAL
jgi:hypothetical protein